jgi:hypothetical protein
VKPIIVGMNNPHSIEPRDALIPSPVGSAGYRIYEMLRAAGTREGVGISHVSYMDRFDRINMLNSSLWRIVVLCGKSVATTLSDGLKGLSFNINVRTHRDFQYYLIPHPSGLCREYNDPAMVRRVGELLLELYIRSVE